MAVFVGTLWFVVCHVLADVWYLLEHWGNETKVIVVRWSLRVYVQVTAYLVFDKIGMGLFCMHSYLVGLKIPFSGFNLNRISKPYKKHTYMHTYF